MQKRRVFYTLDAIRGLLAILVMWRHLDAFIKPLAFQETYLAVDVFFLLSGIVLAQAYEDKLASGELTPTNFLLLRIIRIWPLYILGSLIGLLGFVLQGGDIIAFVKGVFYVALGVFFMPNPNLFGPEMYPLNGPAWSLFLELVANAAFGFFVLYLNKQRLIAIIALSTLGLLAMAMFSPRHTVDVGWTLKSLPLGFLRVSFSFFAGVLLYRVFASRTARVVDGISGNLLAMAINLTVCGIMMLFEPGPAVQPYFELAAIILIFPALVYLSLCCEVTQGFASVARFLGVMSFGVYAIHAPLAALIQTIDGRLELHLVDGLAPWGGVVMTLAIVSAAFTLDKIYDRPVRQAAMKWLKIKNEPTDESLSRVARQEIWSNRAMGVDEVTATS